MAQRTPMWRRRESNPRAESRNSEVAKRLWHMLQDVGVSWEWKDDANWQSVATEQEELAAVITAWPLLSADLRQAVLAIVRSADVMAEASCAATESAPIPDAAQGDSNLAGCTPGLG